MNIENNIRALINRLARLDASETWDDDLNPAQAAALEYLSRANRFSRAPSHVAEYFGTTRGTMSQTLKALERKGYLTETRSEIDKRSISYSLSDTGRTIVSRESVTSQMIGDLTPDEQSALQNDLTALLASSLRANGARAFGLCKTCIHHQQTNSGAFCKLLEVPLQPNETTQICHEQVAA